MTKVVFRKWVRRGQGIIALFPETPAWTQSPYPCLSFDLKDGHAATLFEALWLDTVPATPQEYADTQKELERLGYKLKVMKRQSRQMIQKRIDEYNRLMKGHN